MTVRLPARRRGRTLIHLLTAAAAAAALGLSVRAAPQTAAGIERALADRFGLTEAERNTLAGGYETARALPSTARDGIAAIGAIWIDARPSVYLQWAEAGVDFERGSDFDAMTLSEEEVLELSRCRVGACTLQLDAGGISRVAALDWRRSRARARMASPASR